MCLSFIKQIFIFSMVYFRVNVINRIFSSPNINIVYCIVKIPDRNVRNNWARQLNYPLPLVVSVNKVIICHNVKVDVPTDPKMRQAELENKIECFNFYRLSKKKCL